MPQIQVTYIWIDAKQKLHSKELFIDDEPKSIDDLPIIQEEGSIHLLPVKLYRDPLAESKNAKLVLCETVSEQQQVPSAFNRRHTCRLAMEAAAQQDPWFGIEQEYFMLTKPSGRPIGWPTDGEPEPQRAYHCAVGTEHAVARIVVMMHFAACAWAGIAIDGTNAEYLGQWEYQIGPADGLTVADDLWMSRFLLQQIANQFDIDISFHPKPVADFMLGSGGHTNFSTRAMRCKGGTVEINRATERLAANHHKHMLVYDPSGGVENAKRLNGGPFSASWEIFSAEAGNKGASVRIPRAVAVNGCGYLEDRRPAANLDPYVVVEMLVRTVCLGE